MRVGELIKTWRFIRKLNTRDAGAQMGISSSALLRIEKGTVPDGETIIKLTAWLYGEEATNGSSGHQSDDEAVSEESGA